MTGVQKRSLSGTRRDPRAHGDGILPVVSGFLGLSVVAGILVAALALPVVAAIGTLAESAAGAFDTLPDAIELAPQSQKNDIYAINGAEPDGAPRYERIAQIYDQNREEVNWDAVSPYLIAATIAGEDRRFYDHGGVDLRGVVRAAIGNAAGGATSGASTLTMQLVKNLLIQDALRLPDVAEREAGIAAAQATTAERKVKEMRLAVALEKRYEKDEILLAYLNISGFGGNNYGVQVAAQRYYGVSARDVTLAQAASLIAIVQDPEHRGLDDPDNYEANRERRDVIIRNLLHEATISIEQADEALGTPVDSTTVRLTPYTNGCIAANPYGTYFCDYVTYLVPELASLGSNKAERHRQWKSGGYDIYTTLDLRLQQTAQDSVMASISGAGALPPLGAAAVSVEPGTGRILTMAQNTTFDNTGHSVGGTSVNYNTDRLYGGSRGFQAGSTYKLFTLLNWLGTGRNLHDVVDGNARTVEQSAFPNICDEFDNADNAQDPTYTGPWTFKNSAGERGSRTVLAATAASINGAYVSMGLQLNQCETKRIAESLGVHTADNLDDPATIDIVENRIASNPAAILGTNAVAPLTMAAAYAAIANHGTYCAPVAVDRITDPAGNELPGQERRCNAAVEPDVAALAVYALENAMASYAGNPRDGTPLFGKTGTTDDSTQTWLVSSTTTVTTAVWFGNVSGASRVSDYPAGLDMRHRITKSITSAANRIHPGGTFATTTLR